MLYPINSAIVTWGRLLSNNVGSPSLSTPPCIALITHKQQARQRFPLVSQTAKHVSRDVKWRRDKIRILADAPWWGLRRPDVPGDGC